MGGQLQLTLLGGLQVSQDGVPLASFVYRKSLALLCYLAVTGRPRSREALAALFWGETTGINAQASLRKVLADLRQHVASHLIITRRQAGFDREAPYLLDVEAFHRQVDKAVTQRASPLADDGVGALAEAVEWYQGDFLEGFYVRGAPAFEEWVLLQRERLRLSMAQALHRLARHYTACRRYSLAIEYTARLQALEPGQEEVYRQMMLLLAVTGQQGAALRQYPICRQALAKELGVEPSEQTRVLYERILSGDELLWPS